MNFKQRLLRYLIGVFIGIVIVFMMFPQYDWLSWLPNKQVMKDVRELPFYINPDVRCKLECLKIDTERIQQARNEGRIVFSKSDVKRLPKTYYMEHSDIAFILQMTDSTATLANVIKQEVTCECDN